MSAPLATYRWRQVTNHYRACAAGTARGSASERHHQRISGQWSETDWLGGNPKQVIDWLDNGFDFPHDASAIPPVAIVERARWQWSDDPEGEFDYDAYATGETDCFRHRTKRKTRGGINVRIGYGFRSGVTAPTIASYGTFIGAALQAIQAQGFDVAVTIDSRSSRTYSDHPGSETTRVIVSEFGEPVMMREWSAIFSPAGHRHLIFAARCLGELHGLRVSPGMGGSDHVQWSVEWNAESRTLEFDCDSDARSFPADAMTDQLAAVQGRI